MPKKKVTPADVHKLDPVFEQSGRDLNSPYVDAYKQYLTPNAGEPRSEDGYVPLNEKHDPGTFFGMFPGHHQEKYFVLDDPVLIKKKAELRNALKSEYLRQAYNPYLHASGTGGMPYDPMFHRYNAALRTVAEFTRPSPRLHLTGCAFFFGGPALCYYFGERYRGAREKKWRNGEVAYKDREYKCVS